jgi:hypothetical protein
MSVIGKVRSGLFPPVLSRRRIALALAIAVVTDAVQILLGPPGWLVADEVLDLIAMVLVSGIIGFHPLLLPTFVVEFVPMVDMIPTWTGCVAAVVMLRRKRQPAPQPGPPHIDVESTVVQPTPPLLPSSGSPKPKEPVSEGQIAR